MADPDSIPKRRGYYFDKRKGRYRVHISCTAHGRRIERTKMLPLHTTESEAHEYAETMRAALMREMVGIQPDTYWPDSVARARARPKSWLHDLYGRAKKRAAAKRRAFTLTVDELAALLLRSGGRCEVTGLAFSDRPCNGSKMRPLAPSIDRRDCAEGYTSANCRIVCSAVNVAMFTWGEDLFKSIALGYLINQVIAPHAPILQVGGGYRLGHGIFGISGDDDPK